MSSKRKTLAIVGALAAFIVNFSAVGITRFSDLQIVAGPGGDPVLNAQRWRAWAGDRKSVLIDCTDEPFDFNTGGTPIRVEASSNVQISGNSVNNLSTGVCVYLYANGVSMTNISVSGGALLGGNTAQIVGVQQTPRAVQLDTLGKVVRCG